MTRTIDTEVLVVGSGPGGSLTAATLAERGLDVVVAEEGPWLDAAAPAPFSPAEMEAKYRNRGMSILLGAPPISFAEGRCAGGGSEVNSGLFHRPPGELVDQWRREFDIADLDPDDLDRRAAEIERELSVSSLPGPPPETSAVLERGARSLGWGVTEVPRVFRYPADEPSYQRGVKQTMTRTYLTRAKDAGARVLVDCRVRRLGVRGPRVVGAECRELLVRADHVFVCAGAIETPALLQRSGVRGRIGRGLKVHPTIKLGARFPDVVDDRETVPMHQVKQFAPDLTLGGSASGAAFVALTLSDTWSASGADAADWPRMAVYYASIRSDGGGFVRAIPGMRSPVAGYRLTEADLSRLARGAVALGELLFAAGADRLYPSVSGAPPLESPSDLVRLWDDVTRRRASLMTIHLLASVRMGERRDRTGTDSFGRVWGFENLYVNDASVVPDAPGVNPQGTIMAIAARNCERFLEHR